MKEVIRDTFVKIRPDEAVLQAYLECDSNGKVLLKQLLAYEAGERLKPPKIVIRDNVLKAEAKTDSMAVYLALKDRYFERNAGMEREVVRRVEVNVLTGWQKFRIGIGNVILILFPLAVYLKIKGRI